MPDNTAVADKSKEKAEKEVEVISADDLLKSIQELEAGREDEPKGPRQKAEKTEIQRASDTVEERASGPLRKALDVSETLEEITSLLGLHVDNALDELRKSVDGAAERDLAIARVLKDLKKSVDGLAAKVEQFGRQPGRPAGSFTGAGRPNAAADTKSEVLEKSASGEQKSDGEQTPEQKRIQTRRQILSGLTELVKNAAQGSAEQSEFTRAAITFESAGQIKDEVLAKALAAYKKAHAS